MSEKNLGIYTIVNIISNRSKIICRTNKTYADVSHLEGTDRNDPVTLAYEEVVQGKCPMLVKTREGHVQAKNVLYKV